MKTEDEQKTDENSAVSDEPAATRQASGKSSLSVLAGVLGLILAVAAASFAAYNYRNLETLAGKAITGEQIAQLNGQFRRLDATLQDLGGETAILASRQEDLENELQGLLATQEGINRSVEQLYEDQGRDQDLWPVAEVEHLINIANVRLMLEQDPQTALVALEMADRRLAALGDPGLFAVRRQLAGEMNALRSVTPADITGLALYLADLVTRVADFPLQQSVVADMTTAGPSMDPTLPAWRRVLGSVWNEFKGMFVITRTGDQASATLLPDEKYFIYQNLRLQLEVARLAVLRRDTDNLRKSLQIINGWLDSYFDGSDTAVVNVMRRIERMQGIELAPVLPDISLSLRSIRGYLDNNRNGAGSTSGGAQ